VHSDKRLLGVLFTRSRQLYINTAPKEKVRAMFFCPLTLQKRCNAGECETCFSWRSRIFHDRQL